MVSYFHHEREREEDTKHGMHEPVHEYVGIHGYTALAEKATVEEVSWRAAPVRRLLAPAAAAYDHEGKRRRAKG